MDPAASYQFSLTDTISCGLGIVRSKEVPAVGGDDSTTVKECLEKYRWAMIVMLMLTIIRVVMMMLMAVKLLMMQCLMILRM